MSKCAGLALAALLIGCNTAHLRRLDDAFAEGDNDPKQPASEPSGDADDAPVTRTDEDGDESPPPLDCSAFDTTCGTGQYVVALGTCVTVPRPDGTACDDGAFCSDGETCRAGQCTGGLAHDCSAFDDVCAAGACNEALDACEAVAHLEWTGCAHDAYCVIGETCTPAGCSGGVPRDCSAFDGPCTVGTCDEDALQCQAVAVADDTPCDDGDPCTLVATCQAGACVSTSCELPAVCTSGGCVVPSLPGNGGTLDTVDADFIEMALRPVTSYPVLAYYDAALGDLRVAEWDGAAWRIDVVDSTGDVGRYCDVALDSAGAPHVSYYDATNRRLKHAVRAGESWLRETVPSFSGDVGQHSSIAVDTSGVIYISFYNATDDKLGMATYRAEWDVRTIESDAGTGTYSQMLVTNAGVPLVAYRRRDVFHDHPQVRVRRFDGSVWVQQIAYDCRFTWNSGFGSDLSLAMDSNGHLAIALYNDGYDDVYCGSCSQTAEPALLEYANSAWVFTGKGKIERRDYTAIGQLTEVAIAEGSGDPYMLYQGMDGLMLAKRTGSVWSKETWDVDAEDYAAMAMGHDQVLQMAYAANGALLYRRLSVP